jgi:hypothetical protein
LDIYNLLRSKPHYLDSTQVLLPVFSLKIAVATKYDASLSKMLQLISRIF